MTEKFEYVSKAQISWSILFCEDAAHSLQSHVMSGYSVCNAMDYENHIISHIDCAEFYIITRHRIY